MPSVFACLGLATFVAPSASAHIRLLDPPPRYELQGGSDNGIKSCPCGLGGSNRICNVAQDGSDPDRSTRVSTFEAGSTIMLRFEEFVNHAGRFRVAFDPDGADVSDFNANILNDVQDPANANGMVWEIPVTLPNMTCENCTLQLVQAMEVDQNTRIADPSNISSYYSCVDIRLVAPGSDGDPAGDPGDGEGDTDPGMTGGDMGDGDMGGDMTGGDTGGDEPAGGDMPSSMTGSGDNGSNTGSQSGGTMSGTPLIPVGSGTPMDSSGTTGSTSMPGAVAMNGATGAATGGVAPGAGMPEALPSLGAPSESSSSSGCSLPAGKGGRGAGALGLGVFGLAALFGLRRSRVRAS
ncbi:MAG TPA: SCE4755 family polysaccharide monooxygenase-like protein [Polyangiaceae bacterium]|nr:SCE4755 family polysaccharide monooxygenase-like protein [Polyangiaceae bacterium]